MTSVSESWRLIELWLRPNAPQVLEALSPAADEDRISALESLIGVPLPHDVRQSFLIHDGCAAGLVNNGDELLSLEGVAEQWGIWKGLLDADEFDGIESEPAPGVRHDWWCAGWIPLTHDGSGDHICIDLDPAPHGECGQIIEFWHDLADRNVVAPSFSAWLAQFAYDLESGLYKAHDNWLERIG